MSSAIPDALVLQGGDGGVHLVLRLLDAVRWHAFQAAPASSGVTFETVIATLWPTGHVGKSSGPRTHGRGRLAIALDALEATPRAMCE